MAGKFTFKTSSNDQYQFNLKAGNGEIVLTSHGYTTKADAENGIESVKKNSAIEERFDRRIAEDNSAYFVLKAENGEIIGYSEMYSGSYEMENGIESVKRIAPFSLIDGQTEQRALTS